MASPRAPFEGFGQEGGASLEAYLTAFQAML